VPMNVATAMTRFKLSVCVQVHAVVAAGLVRYGAD
jgi:hypothetical protein